MKHIKNFENYINEELKILTGPSDEELEEYRKYYNNLSPQEKLELAAKNNNMELAKQAIEQGADVDKKDKSGYTPIDYATNNNYINLIPYLMMFTNY